MAEYHTSVVESMADYYTYEGKSLTKYRPYTNFKLTGPARRTMIVGNLLIGFWEIPARYVGVETARISDFTLLVFLAPPFKGDADALRAWTFADRVIPKTGLVVSGTAIKIVDETARDYGGYFRRME